MSFIEEPKYGVREFGFRPILSNDVAKSVPGTSVEIFDKVFPDDDACLAHVFDIRFGQGYPCRSCGKSAIWIRRETRRSFIAQCCRNVHVYPLSNSLFHRTKVPLKDWFLLILHFVNSKTGMSSTLARRLLGVPHRTAFYLCDRIRTHLAMMERRRQIGGPGQYVYVDEAMVRGVISGKGEKNTVLVLGICTENDLITTVIPNRKSETLVPIIERLVKSGSILATDGFASYNILAKRGWRREVVNHSKRIFVNENGISQAQIETYWGHLKRNFRLNHLKAERANIWKYINSFNFVYNRRHRSREIFWDAISAFPVFPQDPAPYDDMDAEFDGRRHG